MTSFSNIITFQLCTVTLASARVMSQSHVCTLNNALQPLLSTSTISGLVRTISSTNEAQLLSAVCRPYFQVQREDRRVSLARCEMLFPCFAAMASKDAKTSSANASLGSFAAAPSAT